ncbi:hypothetical protein HETIRDRAFT_100203 [Heterobasidion irregulare TC 32-1]|uniref:Uncharacterized protein n=1 Tax=Heterobasidion irregulare (strain TC 32-1) TaxID=747525 RepID=W4KKT2_HETIT|nr:uncharacterized protein HETIRDRAFT_100203 [Heterobasidion irregulare TC 32-1]ETW86294.1 hypothetical protein HETIRDRAFT_100203 [Heterobasidion irregulare TC 32-1]
MSDDSFGPSRSSARVGLFGVTLRPTRRLPTSPSPSLVTCTRPTRPLRAHAPLFVLLLLSSYLRNPSSHPAAPPDRPGDLPSLAVTPVTSSYPQPLLPAFKRFPAGTAPTLPAAASVVLRASTIHRSQLPPQSPSMPFRCIPSRSAIWSEPCRHSTFAP